jgi:hypothetical protein
MGPAENPNESAFTPTGISRSLREHTETVYGPTVQYCPKAKIEIMALQKDQRLHLPSYRNSGADFS